ncbi:MAG: hypothetical protein V6Z81_05890 [Parvularculales bacterium]
MKTLTTFAFATLMAFAFGSPAQAGDVFECEPGGFLWCEYEIDRSDANELLEELVFISPAYAIGDLGSCVFAECAGREDEYIGDFLLPADER